MVQAGREQDSFEHHLMVILSLALAAITNLRACHKPASRAAAAISLD
jgi:hypothetical protein